MRLTAGIGSTPLPFARVPVAIARGAALIAGFLAAMVAGQFYLGAYAQRFEALYAFRTRGSDGYPFTWESALLLATIATLLSAAVALVLPAARGRFAYLGAVAGISSLAIPVPLAQLWGMPVWPAMVGMPLLGLLVVGLGVRRRSIGLVFPVLALVLAAGTVAVATIRDEKPRGCEPPPCDVTIASVPGPGPLLPPVVYAALVAELRASGAVVEEESLDTAQPFFSIRGRVVRVHGERVEIFEYRTVADAVADVRGITPDGFGKHTVEQSIGVSWVEPPHFYRRGALIVQYIGDTPAIIDLLTRLLGPQFAGQ